MNARDVGFATAAAIAIAGLASAFTPMGVVDEAFDAELQTVLGILALVVGVAVARGWWTNEPNQDRPPVVERRLEVGAPGDDLDHLYDLSTVGSMEVARYYRSRSREALRDVAVAVLTTHGGLTPETAEERIRNGTWTDDEVAAAAFLPRLDPEGADEVDAWIARRVGSDHPSIRRVRRVNRELRAIVEGREGT